MVYYTNADNSILSKYDELHAIAKDYDVVALNEIKPKNGSALNLEILQLPGFDLFTNDLQQSDTRGTCIYVRTEIRACQYNHPIIDQFADAVWITFNFESMRVMFYVYIYNKIIISLH